VNSSTSDPLCLTGETGQLFWMILTRKA